MDIWGYYRPACPIHGLVGPAGECCPGIIDHHRSTHRVLNLTQHHATTEQRAAGVFDLHPQHQDKLRDLLTFDALPTAEDVAVDAEVAADLAADVAAAAGCRRIMIGGAPFMMAPLERALKSRGLIPVYAFSRRESVEEKLPDGTVRKTTVFRHEGFVAAT